MQMALEEASTVVRSVNIAMLREIDGPGRIYRMSQRDVVGHVSAPSMDFVGVQLVSSAEVSVLSRTTRDWRRAPLHPSGTPAPAQDCRRRSEDESSQGGQGEQCVSDHQMSRRLK